MIGSDTVYHDIYMWVDCLRELARTHGTNEVRQIIRPCLRGSAVIWWIIELDHEDRRKLRSAHLEHWFSVLIERFKIQQSVALTKLLSSAYTREDLDRSPRTWIHEMLRYSKAAGLQSTYMALSFTWSRFDAKLRRDIPMPIPATEVIDFLDQVDNMYPSWREQEHMEDDFPTMIDTLSDGTPPYKTDAPDLRPSYDYIVNDRWSYAGHLIAVEILAGTAKR